MWVYDWEHLQIWTKPLNFMIEVYGDMGKRGDSVDLGCFDQFKAQFQINI